MGTQYACAAAQPGVSGEGAAAGATASRGTALAGPPVPAIAGSDQMAAVRRYVTTRAVMVTRMSPLCRRSTSSGGRTRSTRCRPRPSQPAVLPQLSPSPSPAPSPSPPPSVPPRSVAAVLPVTVPVAVAVAVAFAFAAAVAVAVAVAVVAVGV